MGNLMSSQTTCINQLDKCIAEVNYANTSNANIAVRNGNNPNNNMIDPSICHFKHISCLAGGDPTSLPEFREGFYNGNNNFVNYLFLLIIIIFILWFVFFYLVNTNINY